jgi:nucleotide-binding universal stress UspA family protein
MFKQILVGSDGSCEAIRAVEMAAAIAKPMDATVIALNVFNLSAAAAYLAPEALEYANEIVKSGEAAQREALGESSGILTEAGVKFRTRAETGHPVDTTIRVAKEENADMVVVGTHGRNGLQKIFLDSVSDGVARHAPCPVLVVRGYTSPIDTILVASDGSEESSLALRAAAEIAKATGSSITVLNVIEFGDEANESNGEETDEYAFAPRMLKLVKQRADDELKDSGIEYRVTQQHRHASDAIIDYAVASGADLIAIGSRGLGAFGRLLLGSVSNSVLHRAPCPVLVVRDCRHGEDKPADESKSVILF